MKMTAEISMYPFHEDYKPPIKDFIARLEGADGLKVRAGATSTMVQGDYARVMEVLGDMMQWSHERHGRGVFVVKFLPGYEPE